MYNINISQIKLKTSMLKSSLCDYSAAYLFVIGTITVAAQAGENPNNAINIVFENCTPFTDYISEIKNTK